VSRVWFIQFEVLNIEWQSLLSEFNIIHLYTHRITSWTKNTHMHSHAHTQNKVPATIQACEYLSKHNRYKINNCSWHMISADTSQFMPVVNCGTQYSTETLSESSLLYEWVSRGLTSHSTLYRSFQERQQDLRMSSLNNWTHFWLGFNLPKSYCVCSLTCALGIPLFNSHIYI